MKNRNYFKQLNFADHLWNMRTRWRNRGFTKRRFRYRINKYKGPRWVNGSRIKVFKLVG